jgi:tRNA pseudouridine32 synthase/23S rRNA pseudouridine746 synthase
MEQLRMEPAFNQAGKMYGVLLVQTDNGQVAVLKAFSGLLQGNAAMPGWVPPLPGREQVALQEAYTLDALHRIKQRLWELKHLPERQDYARQMAAFDHQRQQLNLVQRQRKLERDRQRQKLVQTLSGTELQLALAELAQASRNDKAELRTFKQARTEQLAPLETRVQSADAELTSLKARRKELSRQLQANMHRVYSLTNFAGQSSTVADLAGGDHLPTGTGECCAPKLLHFAAEHGLMPLAMAEFWWGPAGQTDKRAGEFYGACAERCQPILGFMLSGLSAASLEKAIDQDLSIPILYEDNWLVAVNKPAGLLSVPGRYSDRQDSVLSRLHHQLPGGADLVAVHRLDQSTSGVLLLVRRKAWEPQLRQQFQAQQVHKIYEAIVDGWVTDTEGTITLPLIGDLAARPRQVVDWQRGKPCKTRYQVISQGMEMTRVEFFPVTGRTHQLRVHAAHPMGLNTPIRGDRLYGRGNSSRLYLHARELQLWHPWRQKELTITTVTPF